MHDVRRMGDNMKNVSGLGAQGSQVYRQFKSTSSLPPANHKHVPPPHFTCPLFCLPPAHVVACSCQIRATMQQDLHNMKTVFRQTVFEKAPGARS